MDDYSYIFNAGADYIEKMYEKYKAGAEDLQPGWSLFFEGFEFSGNGHTDALSEEGIGETLGNYRKEFGVANIINGYRMRAHLLSTTNPIKERRNRHPKLDLADYGLMEADLDSEFRAAERLDLNSATLREIIAKLNQIYTGNIGYEFMHISKMEKREWLKERIEKSRTAPDYNLSDHEKKRILDKLTDAVIFEKFLNTKYIGQKRFSLEGGETTIAAIDKIISQAYGLGVREVVMGMAHRGRLNVLANIMGKTYEQIFSEFEGTAVPDLSFGDGDVKYHLGYSSQVQMGDGEKVHLKLVPNPSHLEAVDPVVEGFARAKADLLYESDYDKVLPVLIHGDAAIAGQGVLYETVQMSKLSGYCTGGTLHYVINNQIGFTTNFDDARSSTYCTAAAQLVEAPVFHVNGDDPEAMMHVIKLAIDYRQKFNSDVFIDMVSYRKHGHNEGDDPKFTQPDMYAIIKKHPNPLEQYISQLLERGDLEQETAKAMEDTFWDTLQQRLDMVKQEALPYEYQQPELDWRTLKKNISQEDFKQSPVTGIEEKRLNAILNSIMQYPDDFKALSKVDRIFKSWNKMIDEGYCDWSLAELSAYASILMEGKDVRMSGQDIKRGTFSHRHATLYDKSGEREYNRLSRLSEDQGEFMIYNSLLSEFGVLGFEFGYSMASPHTLNIWEAQFGDFANGAQTMIDQFISSSRSKWQRMSGLVMLLPHGYEGQGPEHSSARLERFLQMCGKHNMCVVNITTSANFFHVIRRQLERSFRVPLIVMSPKSLLRHPDVASPKKDFLGKSRFLELIDDPHFDKRNAAKKVKRLILCSGKVYYDLMEYKKEQGIDNIAIARLEQLYPFPQEQVEKVIEKYGDAELYWVQEEPENMGAWWFILSNLRHKNIHVLSRAIASSPAIGFKKMHLMQQEEIVKNALTI